MLSRFLDSIFGCSHRHYGFPLTVKSGKRSPAAFITGTYVVCLDCGKEMPYDWKQMRIVHSKEMRAGIPALAAKEAS